MAEFLELLAGNKVAVFKQPLHSKIVAETLAAGMKNSTEPFVLVSLKKIVEKFQEWQRELPGVMPYYAVKCNDNIVLLKTLGSLGVGFDCATKAEIDMIINEDIATADKIVYAHPIKTPEYLKHAHKLGIPRCTFDSVEELYKMKALAPNMEGILRISCGDKTAERKLKYKFGCDPVNGAPKLLRQAKEIGVSVVGVSVHVGSRCCDPRAYERAIAYMKDIFDDGISMGHPMTVVDLGGGFPGINNEKISLAAIGKCIIAALNKYFPESEKYEFIAEPGRYFATTPFTAAAKIFGRIKVSANRITEKEEDANKDGYMYFINDGVYMTFSCKHFDGIHPLSQPLTSDDGTLPRVPATVWGPTCDSADIVEAVTYHRKLNIGEWLYWEDVGAYSTATAVEFNGFPKAKFYYYADQETMKMIKSGDNKIHI
uniref:ornithine decarboxylase n=1 Tax=Panagrolaimus superbus TaxID=310955 RepID=A0A914Y3G1_9BILA